MIVSLQSVVYFRPFLRSHSRLALSIHYWLPLQWFYLLSKAPFLSFQLHQQFLRSSFSFLPQSRFHLISLRIHLVMSNGIYSLREEPLINRWREIICSASLRSCFFAMERVNFDCHQGCKKLSDYPFSILFFFLLIIEN